MDRVQPESRPWYCKDLNFPWTQLVFHAGLSLFQGLWETLRSYLKKVTVSLSLDPTRLEATLTIPKQTCKHLSLANQGNAPCGTNQSVYSSGNWTLPARLLALCFTSKCLLLPLCKCQASAPEPPVSNAFADSTVIIQPALLFSMTD